MFLIELPKTKASSVLENFGGSYDTMAENLDIIKNRLVILNPNRNKKGKKGKKIQKTPSKSMEKTPV